MRQVTALLAVAAVALSACGQSEDEKVADALQGYLNAIADRNYGDACGKLAASAKRDLVEYVTQQLPELGTVECESVLKQFVELTDEEQLKALEDVEIRDVRVDGDRATAEAVGGTQTAHLRKIDGDWKISELEFPGDAASASEPPPETTPPEDPTAPDEGGDPVSLIRGRLEGAGYDVQDEEVSGEPMPIGAFSAELKGGASVTVYVHASAEDAATAEAELAVVEQESPDQIEIETRGSTLYVGTIEEPASLPVDDFNELIAVAEGE